MSVLTTFICTCIVRSVLTAIYLYLCSERVNYFYLYLCSERVNYFYLYLYSERVIIKLSFIHSEVCRLKPISDEEVGRTLDGLQGKVHRTRTFDECKLICIANNECKLVAYRSSVKGFVTCRTNYYKKRYIHHGVQYDLRQCEMKTWARIYLRYKQEWTRATLVMI